MRESRREFIKKSSCALGMTALATQMQHFGMMSALAQKVEEPIGGDAYKALVLVYMAGGNDGNNTVIPNHNSASVSNYAAYNSARSIQGLALAQGTLLPINVPRMGNLSYGLHPSLAAVHPYWNGASVKMAVVANVGTLVRPLTKAQYLDSAFSKPYQLFSHSDQVAQSQTGLAGTQTFTGWGGRVADKMDATSNPNRIIPMITSISGTQLFTSGQTTLPMAIARANNTGPVNLANVLNPVGFTQAGGAARLVSFNQLRTYDLDSEYIQAASHITDEAMIANTALQTSQEVTATFPNTNIGLQLKQVARLIKKRLDLNVNRQVFYVQLGSFDTHNNQLADQAGLLTQFSDAVKAFYDEMIVQGMQNNVTTFTLSDFARTLNPAGSGTTVGSDHGWGNHMFVFGGAVAASDFYGMNTSNGTPYPTLAMGTSAPDDTDAGTGRGRWIPTTAVDQYAATLARWFGLAETDQPLVFPNLGNFASSNLGFMTTP
jgi:uncharacterized protein (DUF1501 family)